MLKKEQLNKQRRTLATYGLVAGIVLFAVSAAFAGRGNFGLWERQVFTLFFDLPLGLLPVFLIVTQFGSAWIVLALAAAAYMTRYRPLASKLLVTGTATYLLSVLLKELVGRPRPVFFLPDILQRDMFVGGMGFPSGHTAMATALSLTLLPYLPRKLWFVVPLWIGAVGFSRIYLGVHAPLDIVGGFSIGLGVASAFKLLWKKA